MLKAVVFDLDDTLYLERDFATSGFRAADEWLKNETGVSGLASVCQTIFDSGQRSTIFDKALKLVSPDKLDQYLPVLIEVYRDHFPTISLADDAKHFLEERSKSWLIGLLTDGFAATQRNKISALGLDKWIDNVVCTGDWGKQYWKPHPRGYISLEERLDSEGAEMVYVADNPSKDFVSAKQRGWHTVQVVRPLRVHIAEPPSAQHAAEIVISDLTGLNDCLEQL